MADDTTPATQSDLQGTEDRLETRMKRIEVSLQNLAVTVEKGFRNLREADDQILTVLINIEKRQNAKIDDHEKRIVRLENAAA